ncbi:MAG TPA: hypothetical protein VJT49_24510 [Amycolatopsis sp.]|uniref:hypothetical protein n=1 Tax=Amycolatopsis sp. TaxID=37632 RepID=UPI002B473AA6|nr:hypothetical protein [Amycolatopsis sp.]HKS48215.1 hypothetical protein [Amycolatopsis sp.]
MSGRYLTPSQRRSVAQQAVCALGAARRNHVVLRIRCSASHHVATIYATEAGPVFSSVVGLRAHGNRDFVDTAHGPRGQRTEFVDLLEGDQHADDALPAHCECGAHFLSRTELREALNSAERTLLVH